MNDDVFLLAMKCRVRATAFCTMAAGARMALLLSDKTLLWRPARFDLAKDEGLQNRHVFGQFAGCYFLVLKQVLTGMTA